MFDPHLEDPVEIVIQVYKFPRKNQPTPWTLVEVKGPSGLTFTGYRFYHELVNSSDVKKMIIHFVASAAPTQHNASSPLLPTVTTYINDNKTTKFFVTKKPSKPFNIFEQLPPLPDDDVVDELDEDPANNVRPMETLSKAFQSSYKVDQTTALNSILRKVDHMKPDGNVARIASFLADHKLIDSHDTTLSQLATHVLEKICRNCMPNVPNHQARVDDDDYDEGGDDDGDDKEEEEKKQAKLICAKCTPPLWNVLQAPDVCSTRKIKMHALHALERLVGWTDLQCTDEDDAAKAALLTKLKQNPQLAKPATYLMMQQQNFLAKEKNTSKTQK